jgi:hypothetical protein
MPKKTILLGFEAGTGAEVKIPFHHTIVTGTTQLSGKTTTLEALVSRSGARAIAFAPNAARQISPKPIGTLRFSRSAAIGSMSRASWKRRCASD